MDKAMEYEFTTSADNQITSHADHNWEEWHAYLASDLPEYVSLNGGGICCHTCRVIIVDQF